MAEDGGPWMGPTTAEWVERIARGSTPVREYVDGRFVAWIDTTRPASRPTAHLTSATGALSEPGEPSTGTPDVRHRPPDVTPRSSGSPSGSVPSLGTG